MVTTKERKSFIIVLGFIGILLFIPCVQAQQSIDMMSCGDSENTTIVAGEELTIMGSTARGINLDNFGAKVFDNMTYHGVGLLKIDRGNITAIFYTKYMDPSGDFLVVEITQVGMERDWKFLYGTGKWKGITGGGKGFPFTKGKPISPGTSQGCVKVTGTYELKK